MRDWQKDWELCQAAQPGPWLFEPGEFECNLECQEEQNCDEERQNTCPHYRQRTGANIPKIFTIDCGDFDGLNNVDAHFISEAREALPYWLQRVKTLEQACEEMREELVRLINAAYNLLQKLPPHPYQDAELGNAVLALEEVLESLGGGACDA